MYSLCFLSLDYFAGIDYIEQGIYYKLFNSSYDQQKILQEGFCNISLIITLPLTYEMFVYVVV